MLNITTTIAEVVGKNWRPPMVTTLETKRRSSPRLCGRAWKANLRSPVVRSTKVLRESDAKPWLNLLGAGAVTISAARQRLRHCTHAPMLTLAHRAIASSFQCQVVD